MSKKCATCGSIVDDQANFCNTCGSSSFMQQSAAPQYSNSEPEQLGNGNVPAGAVGAFLFALAGGVLYFLVFQLGYIAGICGLATFLLAHYGYGVLSKTKGRPTVIGVIISVVVTAAVIYLAEYLCISNEIFQVFKEYDMTFAEAIEATPELLADPEVKDAFVSDLVSAYGFTALATFGTIISLFKGSKSNKK